MYTTFLFRILPEDCKLEKCSLSPLIATEVRVRFQSRHTKQLSRPAPSFSKLCCDYARQDLPHIKPNLKESKLRDIYLWRSLRQSAGLVRATGRTGRFFIFPHFHRVPSIGDRSIRTHKLGQQQAEFECDVTDSDRRPLHLATENNYWIIYFSKSHYSRPQLRPLKP